MESEAPPPLGRKDDRPRCGILAAFKPPNLEDDSLADDLPDAPDRTQLLHTRLLPLLRRSPIGHRTREHPLAAAAVALGGALVPAGTDNDFPGILTFWPKPRESLTPNIVFTVCTVLLSCPRTLHSGISKKMGYVSLQVLLQKMRCQTSRLEP